MGLEIKERVFCVGMNKTGTSTLKKCFEALELLPIATPKVSGDYLRYVFKNKYEPALSAAKYYKAFEDRPWNMWDMYKRLDERYPDSRFILTERSPELWWKSVSHWLRVYKPNMVINYIKHLKVSSFTEKAFVESYIKYNEEVKLYFANTDKLLVINLEKKSGWEELCSFLKLPIPSLPFPHVNKQKYSEEDLDTGSKVKIENKKVVCLECNTSLILNDSENRLIYKLKHKLPNIVVKLIKDCVIKKIWKLEYNLNAFKRKVLRRDMKNIQKRTPQITLDDFAVTACFFNPCGFKSRVANFNNFLENLKLSGVPILITELAFGDQEFQLNLEGVQSIRLRTSDIMWQKERLLNIGIKRLLDQGYKKIAWLDSDIVFDCKESWPLFVSEALEENILCQVFSHARIALDSKELRRTVWSAVHFFKASGAFLGQGGRMPTLKHPIGLPRGMTGYGWAARAELLEKSLLYDKAILGGGDKFVYAASFPKLATEEVLRELAASYYKCEACGARNESPQFTEEYIKWAKKWSSLVGESPGYANTGIKDLFHGERRLRKFMERKEILFAHQFDPTEDISMNKDGVWEWSSNKIDLHQDVIEYFRSREEDK